MFLVNFIVLDGTQTYGKEIREYWIYALSNSKYRDEIQDEKVSEHPACLFIDPAGAWSLDPSEISSSQRLKKQTSKDYNKQISHAPKHDNKSCHRLTLCLYPKPLSSQEAPAKPTSTQPPSKA